MTCTHAIVFLTGTSTWNCQTLIVPLPSGNSSKARTLYGLEYYLLDRWRVLLVSADPGLGSLRLGRFSISWYTVTSLMKRPILRIRILRNWIVDSRYAVSLFPSHQHHQHHQHHHQQQQPTPSLWRSHFYLLVQCISHHGPVSVRLQAQDKGHHGIGCWTTTTQHYYYYWLGEWEEDLWSSDQEGYTWFWLGTSLPAILAKIPACYCGKRYVYLAEFGQSIKKILGLVLMFIVNVLNMDQPLGIDILDEYMVNNTRDKSYRNKEQ